MACVHVVTDGSVALPTGAADDLGIRIVPRVVVVGGQPLTLGDGVTLDELLTRADATAAPITFGASDPDRYRSEFADILGWGVEVLSIHGPPALGGDAASARAAAEYYGADAPITVIETGWPSAALGLLVLRAAMLGQDEIPRDQLCRLVDGSTVRPAFLLVGGNRDAAIRAGAEAGGHVDEARPLLELRQGRLVLAGWYENIGDSLRGLADAVIAQIGGSETETHVALVSADADAECAALGAFLESRLYPSETWRGPMDAVMAAMGGRGAFGVACYADAAGGRQSGESQPDPPHE